MNITNALRRIAQLKGEYARWEARFISSVYYREGQSPAYDVTTCQTQLKNLQMEMTELKEKVAIANATRTLTVDSQTMTLAGAIITLAECKSRIALYQRLTSSQPAAATVLSERKYTIEGQHDVPYTMLCDLTIRERDEKITELEDCFQKLNAILEAANHTTEI